MHRQRLIDRHTDVPSEADAKRDEVVDGECVVNCVLLISNPDVFDLLRKNDRERERENEREREREIDRERKRENDRERAREKMTER